MDDDTFERVVRQYGIGLYTLTPSETEAVEHVIGSYRDRIIPAVIAVAQELMEMKKRPELTDHQALEIMVEHDPRLTMKALGCTLRVLEAVSPDLNEVIARAQAERALADAETELGGAKIH